MRLLARVVVVLVVLVIVVVVAVFAVSTMRLNQHYSIPAEALALAVPSDTASIARGKHLAFAVAACVDCHGIDLGGSVFLDVPPFRIVAPNLTRGNGGIGSTFSDADYVRAIRHGVDPQGKPLLVMPSDTYAYFSDRDLADIIAYVKSVPSVDKALPDTQLKPLGRVLLAVGALPPFPAQMIDHQARPPADMPVAATVQYGRYLSYVAGCAGCHGPGLSGGPVPGLPPGTPRAQNITPVGIGRWSEADFFRALRVGKRPDGTTINELMPWSDYTRMTDTEIRALYAYVRSVPPRPTGTR